MNAPEPTAPTPEPGRYYDDRAQLATVVQVGAELWIRRWDGRMEWWSHARWRRCAVGWTRVTA